MARSGLAHLRQKLRAIGLIVPQLAQATEEASRVASGFAAETAMGFGSGAGSGGAIGLGCGLGPGVGAGAGAGPGSAGDLASRFVAGFGAPGTTTVSSIGTGVRIVPQLPQNAASASFGEPQFWQVVTIAGRLPLPPEPMAADDSTRQSLAARRFGMASSGEQV